jgi:mRNA-capping enzyme
MSKWDMKDPGLIPARWLHCPRKSIKLIHNKFLAFKTPLSSNFDNQVPEECRFTVEMLLASIKSQRLKLGLWIDLTNTSRFYNKQEIEQQGVRYLKLQCRGFGETPSEEQTKTFVQVCKNFIAHNPLEIIGVHCTHGYNRTGFLIVSYLVETDEGSLDASLAQFTDARPPGIYKNDYIRELYNRYDDVDDVSLAPPLPAWYLEYDDSNTDDDEGTKDYPKNPHKRIKKEHFKQNPVFMAGVPGVTPILDCQKAYGIQLRVQDICGWQNSGFPGSQPVSMDLENLFLLHHNPYRVSWKADGTRYMMLIQGDGQVYFIDRNNSIFSVDKLTFPHVRDCSKKLKDTLLDGVSFCIYLFVKYYLMNLEY